MAAPAQFESSGVAKQHVLVPRIIAWAALPLLVAPCIAVPQLAVLAMYGLPAIVGALLWLYSGAFPPATRLSNAQPATVAIDDTSVSVRYEHGDTRTIARKRVKQAWMESWDRDHRVAMRMGGGDLWWIEVETREEALRALDALGFGAAQSTFRARLVSRWSERWAASDRETIAILGAIAAVVIGAPVGFFAMQSGPFALAAYVIALFAALYKAVQWMLPRSVVVGTDGITVGGMGRSEFVPYEGIQSARADERGVTVERKTGATLTLPTGPNPGRPVIDPTPSPAAHVLYERMKEAMGAGSLNTDDDARYGILDRRGRSFEQWRDAMRVLGRRETTGATYRATGLDRGELTRVVQDATASPERRLGAAMALAASGDEQLGKHLRIAADTCANERLRIAIEKAGDGELEEDELEEAMSSVAQAP